MSLPVVAGGLALLAASVPQPTQQDAVDQALARRRGRRFRRAAARRVTRWVRVGA